MSRQPVTHAPTLRGYTAAIADASSPVFVRQSPQVDETGRVPGRLQRQGEASSSVCLIYMHRVPPAVLSVSMSKYCGTNQHPTTSRRSGKPCKRGTTTAREGTHWLGRFCDSLPRPPLLLAADVFGVSAVQQTVRVAHRCHASLTQRCTETVGNGRRAAVVCKLTLGFPVFGNAWQDVASVRLHARGSTLSLFAALTLSCNPRFDQYRR